ncbi:MAG: ABC transporter permease [Chloroflexota bacterium]
MTATVEHSSGSSKAGHIPKDSELAAQVSEGRRRRRYQILRSLMRHKLALFGMVVIVFMIALGASAPLLTEHDPTEIDIVKRLKAPGWQDDEGLVHLLGTDTLGRDVWSRLIYGARISLLVGITAVLIAGSLGVILGLISGYFGGTVDDVIMRVADTQLAFPFILLAISIIAVLGPGLLKVIAVLGFSGWVQYGRIVRGQVISLREQEFVQSARAVGVKNRRILLRHVLPNTWAAVIVIASFSVASTILAESSLSFLGLGVPPDVPTWGGMLAEGREYLELAPWLATFPGLAIALTVFGINVVGDWLRDYLDPRLSGSES